LDNNKITITVNNNRSIECGQGDNLFSVLSRAGYVFSGNCGKRGTCQRCLVDIAGEGPVKSCAYTVTRDIAVTISDDNMSILTSYAQGYDQFGGISKMADTTLTDIGKSSAKMQNRKLGAAIDLGTTTIAMELVDMSTGIAIDRRGFMNPQIKYGSDVISRIGVGSTEAGLTDLRKAVTHKLASELYDMVAETEGISHVVVSGNTTMNAILEGYTLDNLGHSPFVIRNADAETIPGNVFFDGMLYEDSAYTDTFADMSITCLPNLSAFVGADALCGALVCDIDRSDTYQLFADLGTNGELILAKQGIGYATSCACGPAFEGMLKRGTSAPTTAFDLLDRLNTLHIVSDDGVLADQYLENGYRLAGGIVVDMDMIRSFLLAKAAICAGIESLMDIAGICDRDISKVYLAGGFGCSLRISSAVSLGLFPESFREKSEFSGNTSLYGAHKCLIDESFIDRIYEFKGTLTAVNLGEFDGFDRRYYSHMNLRPWSSDNSK